MGIFKGSVLIVDDEESTRRMLLHALSRECYYCVTASCALDALDKSVMSDFDVVLLNATVQGTSVIDVLPRFKERRHDTQVIMVVSSLDSSKAVEESMHLGAYDYVTKPLNIPDLVLRVESAMASKSLTPDKKQPANSRVKPLTP
jgi:DNA-binding NtrC family response regulator